MSDAPTPTLEIAAVLAGNASVCALEQIALKYPQVDLSTAMQCFGGMAARTILVPAGTLLTGALTNIDNLCIVSGDITVTTDEGVIRLTGFHVLPAKAGHKRAGLAHADTWWTTVWPTALSDATAIEDEMTGESNLLQTRRPGINYVAPATLED
jgi:hypothetical protein